MKNSEINSAPNIIKEFLLYLKVVKGKSDKTILEYYLDLRTFFRFLKVNRGIVDASTPMTEITISDLDLEFVKTVTMLDAYEFLNYCSEQRNNNSRTRARKCCALRTYFKYLTNKVQKLSVNPVEQLETPKIEKSLPKFLTLDDSLKLLESVDGSYKERNYCIITLFLNCGLRLSELVGLNLSDINENKMIVTGKGNKQRIVYLNSSCISAIKAYLPCRAKNITKIVDKDALFLSRLGKRISNKTVQHLIYEALELAGLGNKGISVHKLRHTAATLMYQHGGVDIRVLKEVLGHENIGTTEIYTHLSADQLENAANSNPLAKIKHK